MTRGFRLAIPFIGLLASFITTARGADAVAIEDAAPPARDVLRISFDAGVPSLRTTLHSTGSDGEANAFRVRELPEPLSATVVDGAEIEGNWTTPTSISIRSLTRADDKTVWTDLNWRRTPVTVGTAATAPTWMLDLQQSTQGTGRLRFTRLVRLRAWPDPAAPGAGGMYRFIVSDPATAGRPATHLNLIATSFEQLRREAPRECERYLRPMFAAFEQEAVFAPDPLVAFQVFAARQPAGASAVEAVESLLPALGAPDFHTRRCATRRMAALGRDGAMAMLQLDRASLSIEQSRRLDEALHDYLPLSTIEAIRLRDDPGFLLDALYSDDPKVREAAYSALKNAAPPVPWIDSTAEPSSFKIEAWRRRLEMSGG